ncbi:hypothetical protein [Ferribacterium limneticum]|uniref:hypothetical protein n=1 Tax=Ferribacterium limneticum TaxID=76259 RepID=UPI001CFA388D|nr:hypothetical protein [Ferribacterium limneticum]UCV20341.1 hypothetical protein KI610_07150 [Ferribacterium limneticum]
MHGGEPSVHFINSVLVTVVVALFVLWRYRLAILGGMRRGDSAFLPLPAERAPGRAVLADGDIAAREQAMRQRVAAAWLLTTAICSLPMAVAYMVAGKMSASPTYALALTCSYMIAALPMIAVSLAWPPWRMVIAFVVMMLSFAALCLLAGIIERSLLGRPLSWKILGLVPLFFDIAWNQLWMAGLFWLLSWPTRLRGVVPITFAAVLVFAAAPFAGSRLTAVLAATEVGTPWVYTLGLNGVFMLIALPVGWLAWLRLGKLAADYEAKRFSDAQLLARTWWLMLVVTIGFDILAGRERPTFALLLVVGEIVLFPLVNHWVMRWLGVAKLAAAKPAPTLLLLRVFGYTARTERLFDRVASRWRLLGPVTTIAAPDVTARTIDPGDYLRWLTGRIDDLFVTSRASLDAKLARLDLAPDPDGRFRINEFCCRDSTWQATVIELMLRADVVIMDVRGISAARLGCEFELQQLAKRLPPQRLVLVVDETTEREHLKAVFGPTLEQVRVIEIHRRRDADRAFEALVDAAGGAGSPPDAWSAGKKDGANQAAP